MQCSNRMGLMHLTNSLEIIIWGRSFTLPVEYDCYEDEVVTEEQIQAFNTFKSHTKWIDKSKRVIEDYCRQEVLDDDENNKKDNIFSYIIPECIFIKHDAINPRVALMCKYRYDLEHGLAVVFSHDGKITVGEQDIIL